MYTIKNESIQILGEKNEQILLEHGSGENIRKL